MKKEDLRTITIGGWYQRTTLHLTEAFNFFKSGSSKLDLEKSKLQRLQKNLKIKSISRELENLEFIDIRTTSGISIRYYEDGLYILEAKAKKIEATRKKLSQYFQKSFKPALDYLFSLGAPTPKILANIKETHPTVIGFSKRNHQDLKINPSIFGQVYSKLSSQTASVYKTKNDNQEYIFIASLSSSEKQLRNLIETQIFFREFKNQLGRYLQIHRKVWEEISEIKEKHFLRGNKIQERRIKLDSYQKTISLIKHRINQMSTYAKTRASLAQKQKIDSQLVELFKYRFEDLFSTLDYIKEIWSMTTDYVSTAIGRVIEVENKATGQSIRSIQVLASIGVIAGILGYLTRDTLPTVSPVGSLYLLALIVIAYAINKFIAHWYANRKYKITFTERSKEL